ncbi:MAG TPA: hypothetical protein VJ488_03685, partial [Dehalococcoidia bacterium]|nr:hypothetical protein [Dehalococcoidia bacterium]
MKKHNFSGACILAFCLLMSLLIIMALSSGCGSPITPDDYYSSQIHYSSRPYVFDHFTWQANALLELAENSLHNRRGDAKEDVLIERVEKVLTENGIKVFPAVRFRTEQPPYLLVVSFRDRIVYYDRILLSQEMTISEAEVIESSIDALGLSSLVIELGGFAGTYPPIIAESDNITFVIETVVEEWLHQYLAFKPLGFLYLLDSVGMRQDPDIIIMNETLAGIVSREVGRIVYYKYYMSNGGTISKSDTQHGQFDFDQEMRKTRCQVDYLLERGDVIGAENYMELRRQMFVSMGYQIR